MRGTNPRVEPGDAHDEEESASTRPENPLSEPASSCPLQSGGAPLSSWVMTGKAPALLPPTREDIERLAGEAFLTIPAALRRHVSNVVFCVEDFPDAEVEREMELESPFDLLGLYRGISLPRRGANILRRANDMIFLYRRPLLDYWCETGQPLFDIVRHVVIHEIGHHFGFSDDDMERIEAEEK